MNFSVRSSLVKQCTNQRMQSGEDEVDYVENEQLHTYNILGANLNTIELTETIKTNS